MNSCECNTSGINQKLTLYKCTDKSYAVVGETITYRIVANNVGNINLSKVRIFDALNQSLVFEVGSIKVDGIPNPLASIITGIDIKDLLCGQSKTVTFRAKIISDKINPIVNVANGSFEFKFPECPTEIGQVISNTVNVIPKIASINVIKTSDKDFVVLGDIITYKVRLKNIGTVDALNVIIKDCLPKEVELIDGSFSINGNIINSVNINKGVNIGNIKVSVEDVVEYSVKVIKSNCNLKIINSASVKFDYRLPNNRAGTEKSEDQVLSTTKITIGINNFKQLSVEENLVIPTEKPDIEEISEVTGELKILKYHVIKTPILLSNEGQKLTGYKLVVHGVIDEVVEYTACEDEQSVHSAHYSIPFTTFIVLPKNYCNIGNIEVEGILEAIYNKKIDERLLFTNATILVKAVICTC